MADWSKDFGELETPLFIKYVKNDVKGRKSGDKFSEYKKNPKKEEEYCFFQRNLLSHTSSHNGKLKGVERFLQHI